MPEVRVLANDAELVASFRLRHAVYSALGYVTPSATSLEIDEYDCHAIPFGSFDEHGRLVGTLRLIRGSVQPHQAAAVTRVLVEHGDRALIARALRPRKHPLPAIVSARIAQQIAAFNTAGYPVCELSRTIVHPEHRGRGLSRGLLELGLAWASCDGPVVLVGACLPEHVPMYARYGYHALPEVGRDHFDSVGQLADAVVCRTDELPPPTRANVDALLRTLSESE
jgi:predicted GNAT family N-acyltransferase